MNFFYNRVYHAEEYAKPGKYRNHKLFAFTMLAGAYIGWRWGESSSQKENYEKYATPFYNEDQIFSLMQETKKPVFLYYYIPGEWQGSYFRKHFLRSAKDNHEKVIYMRINCAKHYDIARNKNMTESMMAFLYKPVFEKKDGKEVMSGYETHKFDKDLGSEGIKCFLQARDILPKDEPSEGLVKYVYNKVYRWK